MIKEISIILAAIGCVFLIIPLIWLFIGALSLILPLLLLAVTVVYAGFNASKLYKNRQGQLANRFLLALAFSIILSFIILYIIFPYVTPKLLI